MTNEQVIQWECQYGVNHIGGEINFPVIACTYDLAICPRPQINQLTNSHQDYYLGNSVIILTKICGKVMNIQEYDGENDQPYNQQICYTFNINVPDIIEVFISPRFGKYRNGNGR